METAFYRWIVNLRNTRPFWFWVLRIINILFVAFLLYLTGKYVYIKGPSKFLEGIGDLIINLLASVVAVAGGYVLIKVTSVLAHRREDQIKVNYRNSDQWKQYGTEYLHRFTLNDSRFIVYCDVLLRKADYDKLEIDDDPNRNFELDSFIKQQYFDLVEAHTKSKSIHSRTVRLCGFTAPTKEYPRTAVIHTMRSTYLAHLLTNRALDYHIKPEVTIRRIFENTARLTPLALSKMSNHIGINALVFLPRNGEKRGYLLMPKRGSDATVAKNGVTASLATRLQMDNKEYFADGYQSKMTIDYIEKGCILDGLPAAIRVSRDYLNEKMEQQSDFLQIDLLGIARDIYEGGKPTFFYAVYLDMTVEEYFRLSDEYVEKMTNTANAAKQQKKKGILPLSSDKIDEVKEVYVADWTSVKMSERKRGPQSDNDNVYVVADDDRLLCFDAIDREKTLKQRKKGNDEPVFSRYALNFEQNLISNFLFLKELE